MIQSCIQAGNNTVVSSQYANLVVQITSPITDMKTKEASIPVTASTMKDSSTEKPTRLAKKRPWHFRILRARLEVQVFQPPQVDFKF